MKRKNNSLTLLMLAVLVLVLPMTSPALAAPPIRNFTATISPTQVYAGDSETYEVVVTNHTSSTQEIGSATISVPVGFTVSSASVTITDYPIGKDWSATLVGSVIQLIPNAPQGTKKLAAEESVTVEFSAVAPTVTGFYEWTTNAYQGTDFATLFDIVGDQPEVEVIASAVCYKEESAWADGDDYLGANWATYTPYAGTAQDVTFYAGQTMEAGTVHFLDCDGGYVTITIELNEGWYFAYGIFTDAVEGELEYTAESLHIQDYPNPPTVTNPPPGQFAYKYNAEGESWSGAVPCNSYYGIHALLLHVVECECPE